MEIQNRIKTDAGTLSMQYRTGDPGRLSVISEAGSVAALADGLEEKAGNELFLTLDFVKGREKLLKDGRADLTKKRSQIKLLREELKEEMVNSQKMHGEVINDLWWKDAKAQASKIEQAGKRIKEILRQLKDLAGQVKKLEESIAGNELELEKAQKSAKALRSTRALARELAFAANELKAGINGESNNADSLMRSILSAAGDLGDRSISDGAFVLQARINGYKSSLSGIAGSKKAEAMEVAIEIAAQKKALFAKQAEKEADEMVKAAYEKHLGIKELKAQVCGLSKDDAQEFAQALGLFEAASAGIAQRNSAFTEIKVLDQEVLKIKMLVEQRQTITSREKDLFEKKLANAGIKLEEARKGGNELVIFYAQKTYDEVVALIAENKRDIDAVKQMESTLNMTSRVLSALPCARTT